MRVVGMSLACSRALARVARGVGGWILMRETVLETMLMNSDRSFRWIGIHAKHRGLEWERGHDTFGDSLSV